MEVCQNETNKLQNLSGETETNILSDIKRNYFSVCRDMN